MHRSPMIILALDPPTNRPHYSWRLAWLKAQSPANISTQVAISVAQVVHITHSHPHLHLEVGFSMDIRQREGGTATWLRDLAALKLGLPHLRCFVGTVTFIHR
jgi:hypothetical protein